MDDGLVPRVRQNGPQRRHVKNAEKRKSKDDGHPGQGDEPKHNEKH